ncbi:D-alanyl-D-alanine carboxypeptidase [Kitasatospora herbaricolor]|uniref:D-alanyl-D-alanine carboxypeptidase/D-alanyl-D-alanine endopeptidase n=1 Tax=Kitasatospora herbaricolor TaxID=68217 RepID=UPI00174EB586|nr:D-alanyl-D-alanine carboxypeptidase/D-alanyl-D-alanine-endopeptidase [Kitasatospora herbaricolor]MDQ0310020.1 D-alanyl-D-alanine carboxypeptidase/D-alanyl-D-alanine-endopeptidase (penicillin-binding protein 4) [Kitasatospora herbaricolor]GGV17433.1 D-alanyl-D-alanine carboxypeptidase [Kitasatospora herbaricolor]
MGAGTGERRGRGVATARLLGAALLTGGVVLGGGGAYAAPSPSPTGHGTGHDDGRGGRSDGHGDRHGDDRTASPSATSPAAKPAAGPGGSPVGRPAGVTGSGAPATARKPGPPPAGLVLQPADGAAVGIPTVAGLRQALAAALQDKSLGTVTFAVADATSGQILYGAGENTPATPASTTKLATSLAALTLIPGDTRIATRVVAGASPADITLVGGGDPTLTALPADQVQIDGAPADADTAPASLEALAARTAAALRAAGTATVRLGYDVSLYTGSPQHADYDALNIPLMTPLMADEGKADPRSREEAPARVADPAGQAAETFAALLKAHGITVEGKAKQTAAAAPAGAAVLAEVTSPTVARLVERLLTTSDNTLAEAIARQVALAAHKPAGFDGAATAVTDTLAGLGVRSAGLVLHDGSGLHAGNTIPPAVLVQLLGLASSPDHPELRPVLTGLPVAGFTGTLGKRFGAGSGAAEAAGLVRAKTGTRSGVNTLAGTVVDADGRLLSFAVMTRTTAPADTARAAMDRIVARLAACGCH